MIPSLVVRDLRSALVEYLATTFALSDDDVRDALSSFLSDTADGIFRGPYLRVRTPFRPVAADWTWPLEWQRDDFVPHLHQGLAFDRLTSVDGHEPEPTIVTTGTGSGKTECFLYPILDHCARMRASGQHGIKAVLLYPMNALASDQAGRLAELIASEPELAGVTAGVYVGGEGRHASVSPDHLIDKREVLRADPPDILLTNYKMLDFLLLRREDRNLWAVNRPETLQYVVLDEFHTYDGAQGTDLAMLLRRLGRTLQMHEPGRPLGAATPVATSATLGSGEGATEALRSFAAKVFGIDFGPGSIIGEQRQTVEEACTAVDYLLPIPEVGEVVGIADDLDAVGAAFCAREADDGVIDGPLELGERLLAHPLTRAVLAAVGERTRGWSDAVAEIVTRAPSWGAAAMKDPASVEGALAAYLWLLSIARRRQGDRIVPLFSVEVQLWVREVSRLLREVAPDPAFRWRDSAATSEPDAGATERPELPAAYCRRCGMSGWIALQSDNSPRLNVKPASIYAAVLERSAQVRVLLRANPLDPSALFYDTAAHQLRHEVGEDTVAVLATLDEDAARANRCPGCAENDAIRFLGLRMASLASVSINTLFASPHVHAEERKLLAFTDSVQDASHRAAFFAGRTHRINLRSLMARIIEREGRVTVADLGDLLAVEAETDRDRFGLVPPDLLRDPLVRTTWSDAPDPAGVERLRQRLGFEVDLEFGLRSRVGRTLELSRVAAAAVSLEDFDALVDLSAEDLQAVLGEVPAQALVGLPHYVDGLLERLRLRGGLRHPFLAPYVADGGRLWHVWGGRPDGLPPFTPGQSRPVFFTASPSRDLDSLSARHQTPTWLTDWAQRTLGLDAVAATATNGRTFALLAQQTDAVVEHVGASGRVYGLDRQAVLVEDIVDDDELLTPGAVRCGVCGSRQPVPPATIDRWVGEVCLRYRCPGTYGIDAPRPDNYYRRLYRGGHTRRVVTGEHTGLLGRTAREDLEEAFKVGTAPDAPNVLTATPTLEMGIDIGDLSAVMLAGVPRTTASYVQRVGRAGRVTGNALITTFVGTDTHGLYYLADPEAMIAGQVRPPDCYLDAIDTLRRQYLAYLIDRIADLSLEAPALHRQVGQVIKGAFEPDGLFRRIADASMLDPTHVETFLGLFGSDLEARTVDALRDFATGGIEPGLKDAAAQWSDTETDLANRRKRITTSIDKLGSKAPRSPSEEEELSSLRGQRQAVITQLRAHRDEYTLAGLERLGLLPNYTLVDDGITLEATTWWRDDEGSYETDTVEYTRTAGLAIRELAPGNSFYAAGHRHVVDALDIGPADEPHYEPWRLCPECGYGRVETPEDQVLIACPRCAAPGIADMGALHPMLRLRRSLSSSSEEAARVFDEDDDRRRETYDLVSTVDVEPASIEGAWRLPEKAFGAELAGQTHIRTLNLGLRERPGETLPIGGEDRHLSRFRVCRQCGAVASVRDDRDGARPERLHQGWCKVRSKALKPEWDDIVLYHQLTTEAVRVLLPISLFEVDERLVSFTGALLLGLREDFGGDPSHLRIVRSESPNRGGQGRRRFLVLYDAVPGGTGYLARLADPDRVRAILQAGLRVISTCPCQHEGRKACHRCLLGVIDRPDYDLASRELARELLEDLLEGWHTEPVDSVAGLDMGKVEESELERRFKLALRDWTDKQSRQAEEAEAEDEPVIMRVIPGKGRQDAFELIFRGEDGRALRYRIDEQEGLSTTPNTVPDYVIRRADAKTPDVAIYLDGFQFHASADHDNIADDARKRAGVRASGRLVWNLTWDDVDAFHKAALSTSSSGPPPRRLLDRTGEAAARNVHHATEGVLDHRSANANPMTLLLDYLRHPVAEDWGRLALSTTAGAFAAGTTRVALAAPDVREALALSVANEALELVDGAEPAVMGSVFETAHGHRVACFLPLPADGERWTLVSSLPDGPGQVAAEGHRARWQDWLQWANLAQFLKGDGRDAVICARSTGAGALDDGWLLDSLAPVPASAAPAPVPLKADLVEELDLLELEEVRTLVRTVLDDGAPAFVAGYEAIGGGVIEAAWPEQQVGIIDPSASPIDLSDWDLRPADQWTVADLAAALKEN